MRLSDRIMKVKLSATTAMGARAKALRAQGRSVVSFTTGEPDFNTPEAGKQAAIKAIQENKTHYTVVPGIPELRQAIADYYKERFHQEYTINEITTGTGAKQLLFESLGCLVNPGDEVIMFAPAWVSYYEQIQLFGGVPVVLDTSKTNFLPDPDEFEKLITDKTVAIVLNNPNNPSGMILPHETLKKIAQICVKHGVMIINDEIYERLAYGVSFTPHLLELVPEARDFTININGASKSYAMTGWRLGYALGPEELIKAMNKLQGHITTGASSITQYAGLGSFKGGQDDVEYMLGQFAKRRELAMGLLDKIPGITYVKPQGAFYIFIDVSNFVGEGKKYTDDIALCNEVLEKKGLGIVPGTAFMVPGYIRMSYACSEDDIKEGLKRFAEFLAE